MQVPFSIISHSDTCIESDGKYHNGVSMASATEMLSPESLEDWSRRSSTVSCERYAKAAINVISPSPSHGAVISAATPLFPIALHGAGKPLYCRVKPH